MWIHGSVDTSLEQKSWLTNKLPISFEYLLVCKQEVCWAHPIVGPWCPPPSSGRAADGNSWLIPSLAIAPVVGEGVTQQSAEPVAKAGHWQNGGVKIRGFPNQSLVPFPFSLTDFSIHSFLGNRLPRVHWWEPPWQTHSEPAADGSGFKGSGEFYHRNLCVFPPTARLPRNEAEAGNLIWFLEELYQPKRQNKTKPRALTSRRWDLPMSEAIPPCRGASC